MHEINKERFGAFIQGLRKERSLTQAQLAQRLYVSDKAVSKWERGLSLPDVSLLMPLAEALQVTVIELLEGQRLEPSAPMDASQAEMLVQRAITLSEGQGRRGAPNRGRNGLLFGLCLLIALAEIALLLSLGHTPASLADTVFLVVGLSAGFALYFWLLVPERLPAYHDEHRITGFMDGPVRMNTPGLSFNNRNWPHIVKAMRISLTAMMIGYPLVHLAVSALVPAEGARLWQLVTLALLLGKLFIPLYVVGKKHE